jgi:YD repeat-containing protein
MSYDGLGRLMEKDGANGQKQTYRYDPNGNVISVTNAMGHTVAYQYDALNRVAKIIESGGATLGVPALSVPSNNTSGSYTVGWNGVSDATSYTLQEQANGGSWSTVYSGSATSAGRSGKGDGNYSYRVEACNGGGCGGWSATAGITVLLPPPAPASISVPSASGASVAISWASSSTATSYVLQQAVNGGGWSAIYTGSATSHTQAETATGSYTYRVQACNTSGCGGCRTSSAVAVTLPPGSAPNLSVPGVSGTGSYTVSWGGIGGASSYTLQEQANGGGWTAVYSGNASSHAITGKSNGSTYGYEARACNAGGCGPWSAVQSVQVIFSPGAPTNAHETMSGSVKVIYNRVVWDAVSSATSYQVTLDGSSTIVYSGADTMYTIGSATNPDEPDGDHTAFVRACNAGGCSAWTKAPPYYPPAFPVLTGPTASGNGNYTLSWNSVSAMVDNYVLQQQVNGGSWSTIYSGLNLSMTFSGKADSTYGYRIESCIVNECGGWGGTFTVTVARPPAEPASINVPSTSSGNLTVSWPGVSGASSYTLQHQKNGGSWSTLYSGSATSHAVTETSNGSYAYRVEACNAGGCSGYRTSGTVTVTLPAAPAAPTGVQITSRGSYKVVTYTATWNAVTGATSYQAERTDTGAQVYSGTATSFTIGSGSPDDGPPYYFQVRACNANGCSGWVAGY